MYGPLRDPRHWALPAVLAWQASERAEDVFVRSLDGPSLTFGQAALDADKVAGFLGALGVQPGDAVAVLLPNGLDFVRAWAGLGRLGAVAVLLNIELTGAFLTHQLEACGARVLLTSRELLPAVEAAAARGSALRTIVLAGSAEPAALAAPLNVLPFSGWETAEPYGGPMPAASDVAAIMYTSGTTGPSKGVMMPHAHCYLYGLGAIDNVEVGPRDLYYVTLPLYHANGLFMQVGACLIAGATVLLRSRFSASAWVDDIQAHGATLTNLLGAMTSFVFARPPGPNDRLPTLRRILSAPNPAGCEATWRERFGVQDVVAGFGMTEVNIPVWGRPGDPAGCAGRVYERYFHVEVRDPDTDVPLEPGTVGEIMVRPLAPFGFMAGYHGLPDKTCEAWRNLWFHTGDAGVFDHDGVLTFVDRIRDCIRRRGHNISSAEVEAALASFPGVGELAAYAVPSSIPGGEDEIMLDVVPAPGCSVSLPDLMRFADAELPRFARPRYAEIVDALPKTGTGKVRKTELRARGITPMTFDRDATADEARRERA